MDEFNTQKRKAPTKKARQKILDRQQHSCAGCGCWLLSTKGEGKTQKLQIEFDHILPLWLGGSNELDNLQALCKKCHSKKTIDESFLRAKNNRQRKARLEGRGRKRRGKKLESRGFDTRFKRKMNGEIECRSVESTKKNKV